MQETHKHFFNQALCYSITRMTLRTRLARLEHTRPPPAALPDVALPVDLCARIYAAQMTGTYPESLCNADLEAIVAAGDLARGQQ